MKPELEKRMLKVSRTIDRLAHVRHIVEQIEGTSIERHVAAAAIAAAEYVAAATGNEDEVGLIHRAYEEILASMEHSPALREMLQYSQVPAYKEAAVSGKIQGALQSFRLTLAGMEEDALEVHEPRRGNPNQFFNLMRTRLSPALHKAVKIGRAFRLQPDQIAETIKNIVLDIAENDE